MQQHVVQRQSSGAWGAVRLYVAGHSRVYTRTSALCWAAAVWLSQQGKRSRDRQWASTQPLMLQG